MEKSREEGIHEVQTSIVESTAEVSQGVRDYYFLTALHTPSTHRPEPSLQNA